MSVFLSPSLLPDTLTIDTNITEWTGINDTQLGNLVEVPVGTALSDNNNTPWLDVKSYTSVVLTHEADDAGTVVLLWANTDQDTDDVDARPRDINDTIATDTYTVDSNHITRQFDMRARWLSIVVISSDTELKLTYGFKNQPTEIKLTDDYTHTAHVQQGEVENSLKVSWADVSGGILTSTGTDHLENKSALYVTLTNHEAYTLDSVPGEESVINTLTVALRDNDGLDLDSTSVSGSILINSNLRQDWSNYIIMDDYMLMSSSGTELGDTVNLNNITIIASLNSITNVISDVSLNGEKYTGNLTNLIKPGYVISDDDNGNLTFIQNINALGDVSLVGIDVSGEVTINSQLLFTGILENLEGLENTIVIVPTHHYDSSYVALLTDAPEYYFETIRDFSFSEVEATYTSISGALEWMDDEGYPDTDASNQIVYISRGEFSIPPLANHTVTSTETDNIFYLDLSVSKVELDPLGSYVDTILGYPVETLHRHVSVPEMDDPDNSLSYLKLQEIGSTVRDFLYGNVYTGHNSLHVVMSDVCGHAQASSNMTTEPDRLSHPKFGDVALYYSLADNSGVAIGNTYTFTDSSNAIYVYPGLQNNQPVDNNNPMPITDKEDAFDTQMHDTSMGSNLVTIVDTIDTDFKSFNIHNLNLVNELATTAWVKIYDIHPPLSQVANNLDNGHRFIEHQLKLNVAVPGLGSRALIFDKAMTFNYGLVVRAMHTPRYSDNEEQDRVDNNQVYLDMTRTQFAELESGQFPTIDFDLVNDPDGTFGTTFDVTIEGIQYTGWIAGDPTEIILYLDAIEGVAATSRAFGADNTISFDIYNAEGVKIASVGGVLTGEGYGNTYTVTTPPGETYDFGAGQGVLNTVINTNVLIDGTTTASTFTVWSKATTFTDGFTNDVQGSLFKLVNQTDNTTILKDNGFLESITVLPTNANVLRQLDISIGGGMSCYDIAGIEDSSYGNFTDINQDGCYLEADEEITVLSGSQLIFTTVSGYVSVVDYDTLFIDNCANNYGDATADNYYYGTASGDEVSFNNVDLDVSSRAYVFSTPAIRGNIYYHDDDDTSGYRVTLIDDARLVSGADISLYFTDNNTGTVTYEPENGISFASVTYDDRTYWQSDLYTSTDVSYVSFAFHNFDLSLICDKRLDSSSVMTRPEHILIEHL